MNEADKAYLAGIIDGEGSIMLIRFHSNQFPSPCITISSSTIELLQWIKEITNCGAIKVKKNYNPDNHKDSFTYEVKYNDAIYLLKEITPYLVVKSKKERSELIINNYKSVTPRNGRYSPVLLAAKETFYEEFVSIK